MKQIGLIVLIVGVALSASAGARLSPEMKAKKVADGAASFRSGLAAEAKDAYCAARAEAKLADAEGCGESKAPEGDTAAQLEALKAAAPADLAGDAATTREAWLAALGEAAEAQKAADAVPTPAPEARIEGWMGESLPLFAVGLLLVVVGAVIGRRAAKAELAGTGKSASSAGPRDFGEMLGALHDDVAALATKLEGIAALDEATADTFKDELDRVKYDYFEPLIETRGRLQVRFGMGGFAEIFGPLSASERRVNRTWSALVDGHAGEAKASLRRAVSDLEACKEALDAQVAAHA